MGHSAAARSLPRYRLVLREFRKYGTAMGVRFLPVLFASIALTAACGPRCLYWWDATGKNRDERIAVVDSKTCHLDEAYRMKDFLAQDHAYDQMFDCMKRHGWVMSDRVCPPNER